MPPPNTPAKKDGYYFWKTYDRKGKEIVLYHNQVPTGLPEYADYTWARVDWDSAPDAWKQTYDDGTYSSDVPGPKRDIIGGILGVATRGAVDRFGGGQHSTDRFGRPGFDNSFRWGPGRGRDPVDTDNAEIGDTDPFGNLWKRLGRTGADDLDGNNNGKRDEKPDVSAGDEGDEDGFTYNTNDDEYIKRMQDILDGKFGKDYDELKGRSDQYEKTLFDLINSPTDFGRVREELTVIAQAVADEIFGTGGVVDQENRAALDQSVETGFGPSSGGFTAARQNILGKGRDVVGRSIAQNGAALAGLAVQDRGLSLDAAGNLYNTASGRVDNLRESIFGGQTVIENLRLAREQQAMNKKMLDKAIKEGNTDWLGALEKGVGFGIAGLTLWDMWTNRGK